MIGRIVRVLFLAFAAVLVSAMIASSGSHPAAARVRSFHMEPGHDRCKPVGGSVITNFGAVDANTTLGPATGDLAGAVAAGLLAPPASGPNGTVVFHIQHHWVTDAGDNILFDPAIATTQPISQTLFAVITYKTKITGGTGRFDGATGELDFIGEADLVHGTAFRYSGEVCSAN